MELLSPRRNPDTPTSPVRRNRRSGQHSRQARVERRRAARLSSPMWVEVAMSQLSIAARRGHRFVITCFGISYAGTIIDCSPSASQGGRDCGVTLPHRDAERCLLHFFVQHQLRRV